MRLCTLLLFLQQLFPFGDQQPLATFDIDLPENTFVAPQISPDAQYVIVSGSSAKENYLILCDLNSGEYSRIFDQKSKKKKKKSIKKLKRVNKVEHVLGWLMDDGQPYLYTAVDEIISADQTVTVFYEHGSDPREYDRYFKTEYPNKTSTSFINSSDEYVWIAFINSPYGLYKIDLKKSTMPLSKEPVIQTDRMIQGVTAWENREIFFSGHENIYKINEIKGDKASQIDIDLSTYTIIRDIDSHSKNEGVFSFIGSNAILDSNKIADLCIYDLNKNKYIKKLEVYYDRDAYVGNRYSQWASSKERLYYLKKNGDEISLFYFDFLNGNVRSAGLNEKKIKSFAISNDGRFCVILRDTESDQITVYKLND